MASKAPAERLRHRSATDWPRPVIRTTVDSPLATFVTWTRDPTANARCADVVELSAASSGVRAPPYHDAAHAPLSLRFDSGCGAGATSGPKAIDPAGSAPCAAVSCAAVSC